MSGVAGEVRGLVRGVRRVRAVRLGVRGVGVMLAAVWLAVGVGAALGIHGRWWATGAGVALAGLAAWWGGLRAWAGRISEVDAGWLVERARPDAVGRVVSALELAGSETGSAPMREELARDADAWAAGQRAGAIVTWPRGWWVGLVAMGAWAGLLAWPGARGRAWVAMGGDGRERGFAAEALAVEVQRVEVWETLPAYRGGQREARDLAALTLFEGSTVEIAATASEPLAEAAATLGRKAAMTVTGPAAHLASLGVSRDAGELGVSVRTAAGGIGERVMPVQVVRDAPPTARMVGTGAGEVITSRGRVRLAYEMSDDFGIALARVCWRVGPAGPAGATRPAREGSMALQVAPNARHAADGVVMAVADLGAHPGERAEAWVEVKDGRGQIGTSEAATWPVGTDEEVRAALASRVDRVIDRVEGARDAQQDLADEIGRIVLGKAGGAP